MGRTFATKPFLRSIGGLGYRYQLSVWPHRQNFEILNGVAYYPNHVDYLAYGQAPFTISDTHWVGVDGKTAYSLQISSPGSGDPNYVGSYLMYGLSGAVGYDVFDFYTTFLCRNNPFTIPQLDVAMESPAAIEQGFEGFGRMILGSPTITRTHYAFSVETSQQGENDIDLGGGNWWHPTETAVTMGLELSAALIGIHIDGETCDIRVMAIEPDHVAAGATEVPITALLKAYLVDWQGDQWADAYMIVLLGNDGELTNSPEVVTGTIREAMEFVAKMALKIDVGTWRTAGSTGEWPVGTIDCDAITYPVTNFYSGFFNSSASGIYIPSFAI